ncbi:MAG: group 1 truncated hemoglobin [Isosphaeraceae bacterium]
MTPSSRHLGFAACLCLALAAGTGAARAADAPKPDATDIKINQGVVSAITLGVDLYNGGDPTGCYRVYQGALRGITPLLDAKPDLKKMVVAGLEEAELQPTTAQRATALRRVLDSVYDATNPRKSLWTRLGGEPAVKAVVHDFVGLAATDPKVDFLRGGKYQIDAAGVANLEKLLVEMVSEVSGGPLKYSGRDMKTVHAGMAITKEQFGAIAADLIAVLKKYKVPQKEIDELVGIIATTQKDIVEKE